MENIFLKFKDFWSNDITKEKNLNLIKMIRNFSIQYFPRELEFDKYPNIKESIINSKIVLINELKITDQDILNNYFIFILKII